MTTVEDVICKARELAENAGKKTSEWVTIGKLKLDISENERLIRAEYEWIGKAMYEANRSGVSIEEKLAPIYVKIDALQQENAKLSDEMDVLRNAKRCTSCGKANPKSADFCQKCGEKL